MQNLVELNRQFMIPRTLRFEMGQGGLVRAVFTTPQADARIYLYGAHVTHFQPKGQKPVLFLSRKAFFEPGKPIRGGVPVCFPWFGAKEDDPQAAIHGIVRLREWEVETAVPDKITLRTNEPPFIIRHTITVRDTLTMALTVENAGAAEARFEEALHTYFAVSDVRNVTVEGLAGAEYLDKTDNFARKTEPDGVMRLTQEPDRLYFNTRTTCTIHDPGWQRRIIIEKQNSNSTVVWNPWDQRAAKLPDFAADEWPGMLCIETVNARETAVVLPAGQSHVMQALVRVAAATPA